MKILVLSTGLFNRRYGQQRYELNFLKVCFSEGKPFDFRVILLNDYKLPPAWADHAPRLKFALCGKKFRFIAKVKFVILSFWFALKDRPDFLICAHINLSILSLIISRFFKIKYVILTHGTDVWNIKNKFKIRALESASKIITVSHYTASKISQQLLHTQKITILANCVDTDVFMPKEKSANLLNKYNLNGSKVILTVARLDNVDRDKGYDKILAALPHVLKIIPNLKYILVGEGNDSRRIKRIARRLGIWEHLIMPGYVSDKGLADYYNLCDCFVMPSKQEGFGIVFLEAVACGKPVIAGNRDGSRDALLDGKLGILVDPDSFKEIARAIIDILQGKVENKILDRGYLRKMAVEHFSVNRFSKEAKAVFNELINQ